MAKILLVEDDNNLREIYEARLIAEGYEIVGAKDGEEALAVAVREKPDLIISDIMMPKISGFDMLDILRSTAETKHTKVIMMTALSQTEDKNRAERLGADRYLVKSQVTLEDVARVAREVLEGVEGAPGAVGAFSADARPSYAEPADVSTGPTPSTDQVPIEVTEPPTNNVTSTGTTANNPTSPVSNNSSTFPENTPNGSIFPAPQNDLALTSDSEKNQIDNQIDQFVSQADAGAASSPATSDQPEKVASLKSPVEESSELDGTKPSGIADQVPPPLETDHIAVISPPGEQTPNQPTTQASNPVEGPDSTSMPPTGQSIVNGIVSPPTTVSPNQAAPTETPLEQTMTIGGPEHKASPDEDMPLAHKKVIEPISDTPPLRPDINDLLAKEEAKNSSPT